MVASVSAGLADVLGTAMAAGRPLRQDENLADASPVVVLTHSYWSRRLGSDPGVIGTMLEVDGERHEVVGVLTEDARLPEEVEAAPSFGVDAWVPLRLDPADPPRNNHVYQAVSRLAPGVDAARAAAELERLNERFAADMPTAYTASFMDESGFSPLVIPLHGEVVGGSARVLWILFGAVALVLAITCANVANLFLVRLEARRREIAIRSVLGASRGNLVRQLLVESMTLTAFAGCVGVMVAWAGVALIRRAAPLGLPRVAELGIGASAVLFAFGISILIGVMFGVAPGPGRSRGSEVLSETGRGSTATRRTLIVRHGLIAVQIGLSFVLLSGAGLLLRSFQSLSRIDPGFEPRGVFVFRVVLPAEAYPDWDAQGALYRRVSERLAGLPSVERIGMTASLPLGGDTGCTGLEADGPDGGGGCVRVTYVTPGYFAAAGIPVRGRDVMWTEIAAGARVAVISEALARRMFPGLDPIGRRVRASVIPDGWHTIVGVAGDVSEGGLDDPASELAYLPVMPAQPALGQALSMAVVMRTGLTEPTSLLPAVRSALADIDPRVPITRPGTMDAIIRSSMSRLTFMSTLLIAAALMAVLVGAVGIYGVVSYVVAQRRAEIGVRVALGARRAHVQSLIIGQSIAVAAAGIAAGLLLALALSGALRAYLFGVSAVDPLTLAAVAVILLGLAGLASHLPARRALRMDPVEALRP
jgi:predicted permease